MKFIVYDKNGKHVAYSSEYDFVVQGDNLGSAVMSFKNGLAGMVCLGHYFDADPFDHIDQCPDDILMNNEGLKMSGEIELPDDMNYSIEWD